MSTESPASASPGITVLPGAGKYLVPGLIDGHVHLASVPGMLPDHEGAMPEVVAEYDRQSPRSYLYFGFAAVVDLNVVDRARVDRLKAADPGPEIVDCGNALVLANGYPMVYLPPARRFDAYPNFLYDPAQKNTIPGSSIPPTIPPDAAVGRVAAGGGVCVKAHYEPGFDPAIGKLPVPTVSMMTEVREASHRRKLPFLLHANSLDAHRFAAEVKPDAVVHGMWNWGQENTSAAELPARVREVLDAERHAGVAMMPTTRVIGGLADLFVPAFSTIRNSCTCYRRGHRLVPHERWPVIYARNHRGRERALAGSRISEACRVSRHGPCAQRCTSRRVEAGFSSGAIRLPGRHLRIPLATTVSSNSARWNLPASPRSSSLPRRRSRTRGSSGCRITGRSSRARWRACSSCETILLNQRWRSMPLRQ